MSAAAPPEADLAAIRPVGGERTVEGRIARELEALIIEGRIKPGLRLRYRDLATQFGVSVTPVRVALRELEANHLVETSPHAGARVTPLSTDELEEIYAARVGLEGLLARRGVERLDQATFELMQSRFRAVVEARSHRDRRGFLEGAWAYRLPCYEAAGRPKLLASVTALYRRSARYNWLTLGPDSRWGELTGYQRAFLRACADRDGSKAEAVIREIMDWCIVYLVARVHSELSDRAEA